MTMKRSPFLLFAIPVCLISVLIIGAQRSRPAILGGVIDPTCISSLPCIEYDNNGTGPAIRGVALRGNGVAGSTHINSTSATNARAGVFGKDDSTSGTFNSGVSGLSVRGTGLFGASTSNDGVFGLSTNSVGVVGQSTNYLGVLGSGVSFGVYGSATTGYGIVGSSGNIGVFGSGSSYGVYGAGGSSGRGVFGATGSGSAVYASSSTGRAFEGHTSSGLGLYVTNGSGNGGDVAGTYVGVVARGTNFPLVATDPSGNNLFYVDGAGNVFYHGTLNNFAATRIGKTAITFGTVTASPTVEDTGSGHLINGAAVVQLDTAFMQTIDPRTPYHVMLTPDGDTRGLFIASKGPNSFVVREVQGGRGSLAFDYHIYATALGHANERMVLMTHAETASMMPRAPLLPRRAISPPPVIRLH